MNEWRPASGADMARQRAHLLQRARAFFDTRDVLSVDTPALSDYAVTDPHIENIPAGANQYLHTSPEFHMKRLLAAGYPDIYSICRVYRGGERGRQHLPEFTMIEWYRHGFGLTNIVADTVDFIVHTMRRPDLTCSVDSLEYRDAFVTHAEIDPFTASVEQLADAAEADPNLRRTLGSRRDAWLDLLMATRVSTRFNKNALTVVRHYPASQAALARLCPTDSALADRFEVYCGPLELANGYVELGDAQEQKRRMQSDLKLRKELQVPELPADENLLHALAAGLPECAGVALGFERLHMLAAGVDDISAVVTFS